jgi:hypothetical protein
MGEIDGPHEDAAAAQESPRLPPELPPLPSKYYKPNPTTLTCRTCEKRFDSADDLNEHVRIHHRHAL